MKSIKNDSVCGKFNKNCYYFRFIKQLCDRCHQTRRTKASAPFAWEIALCFSLIYLLLKAFGVPITTPIECRKSCAWLPMGEQEKGAAFWWFAMIIVIIFNLVLYLYVRFLYSNHCVPTSQSPMERNHKPVNDKLKIFISFYTQRMFTSYSILLVCAMPMPTGMLLYSKSCNYFMSDSGSFISCLFYENSLIFETIHAALYLSLCTV